MYLYRIYNGLLRIALCGSGNVVFVNYCYYYYCHYYCLTKKTVLDGGASACFYDTVRVPFNRVSDSRSETRAAFPQPLLAVRVVRLPSST